MPAITLRPAANVGYVQRLLSEAGLPTDDVRSTAMSVYVGVDRTSPESGQQVGVGGIEEYGTVGLLRSVVIEPDRRGEGYGTALTAALEARAREDGIRSLYLLTTTAGEFFDSRGYERIERADAPEAIRDTSQFSELCPDSAVCMRKRVDQQ